MHNHNLSKASVLESRMIRKGQVRFGGGTVEKYRWPMHYWPRQLATFLPYYPSMNPVPLQVIP